MNARELSKMLLSGIGIVGIVGFSKRSRNQEEGRCSMVKAETKEALPFCLESEEHT